MKLSDIRGESTFDVLANLIDPILAIAGDEEASALFRKEKLPDGMEAREFALQKARKSLPVLLRNHKRDLITIIAAIKQMNPDEYAKELGLVSLTQDVLELVSDEDFIGFLS